MPLVCDKKSKESILKHAEKFMDKCFADLLNADDLKQLLKDSKSRNKGSFGLLTERYLFGLDVNNYSEPDFADAGLELKTSPLKKNSSKKYTAKERLIFSMINYMEIVHESWESSSFLKKNKFLLLMFYLYKKELSIEKYRFKLIELLDLISHADILQIEKDWKFIVEKIRRGEAHLLSEGDTLYLGAATKASKSTDRREQPYNKISAKPRAFSLKQSYLNVLIQDFILKKEKQFESLIDDKTKYLTVEENIIDRLRPYLGKNIDALESQCSISYPNGFPKNRRRVLINRLLGVKSNNIKELVKADITLRVIGLEYTGTLTESISFPYFKYMEIIKQTWTKSDFYKQLSNRRFLFVVFQKQKNASDILHSIKFWNFPMKDIRKAEKVWRETVRRIKNQEAHNMPGISYNGVAHVRPHGRNKKDTLPTGYGTEEVKRCFWLNAKYIQKVVSS